MFLTESEARNAAYDLGAAISYRDAMSGMYRNSPSEATREWRDLANIEVRRLRRLYKRLLNHEYGFVRPR